jgi:hypothetical protein
MAPSNECWILALYEKLKQTYKYIYNSLITACDLCFFTVKFCSFNTLIYPSKKYNIDKGDESGIVNIFNMLLKVQCRYKHMAWTHFITSQAYSDCSRAYAWCSTENTVSLFPLSKHELYECNTIWYLPNDKSNRPLQYLD